VNIIRVGYVLVQLSHAVFVKLVTCLLIRFVYASFNQLSQGYYIEIIQSCDIKCSNNATILEIAINDIY
jgi:hypothetical protein